MASVGVKGGDKAKKVLADIAKKVAAGKHVEMGFFETATYEDKEHTPVAQVAYWNEYGTPAAVHPSPPRPFFRQTIAKRSSAWGTNLGTALKMTNYDKDKSLRLVGENMQDNLVTSIEEFKNPGNAPSTIERKGFDDPLNDTGTMKRSVAYNVIDESA